MYKVMIVDDYVPILKYMRALIDWNKLELEVLESSHSSVKALGRFSELLPDILITDIDMPQLNGMELAERCREVKPDLRVIFLTCHEEFEYAKGAIQLQADDYLIKDELTAERLESSLKKTVKWLDDIYINHTDHELQKDLYRNRRFMEGIFLQRLLDANDHIDQTLQFGQRLGIQWDQPSFLVILGTLDKSNYRARYEHRDIPALEYAFHNIAQEVAQDYTAIYPTMQITLLLLGMEYDPYSLLIVINFQQQLQTNIYQVMNDYMQEVQMKYNEFIKLDVRFLCSRAFSQPQKIRTKFNELKKYEMNFYYTDGLLQFMDSNESVRWNDSEAEWLAQIKDRIFTKIKARDFAGILEVFKEAAFTAKDRKIDPVQWLSSCAHWIRLLQTETNVKVDEDVYYDLKRSSRWSETTEFVEKKLIAWIDFLSVKQTNNVKDSTLKVVEQYIFDHIAENITLAAVAQHLYLNPNYLSRYFKKISGQNFIDYVHRHKVEIASKMLSNPHETVESIAFKLGYNDRTYFARVFKKYMNMSPSDYRK